MSKSVSRLLSNVLRHKPENIGIKLDKQGWTKIGTLLDQLVSHNHHVDYDDLMDIVKDNDKQRFEIKGEGEDGFIRARQGHSVKVDLGLKNVRAPLKLYHGTPDKFVKSILESGLTKMRRHAVHLSEDIETATKVGSRRGNATILVINAARMYIDGHLFQKTDNGVWLTESVPAKYIKVLK